MAPAPARTPAGGLDEGSRECWHTAQESAVPACLLAHRRLCLIALLDGRSARVTRYKWRLNCYVLHEPRNILLVL